MTAVIPQPVRKPAILLVVSFPSKERKLLPARLSKASPITFIPKRKRQRPPNIVNTLKIFIWVNPPDVLPWNRLDKKLVRCELSLYLEPYNICIIIYYIIYTKIHEKKTFFYNFIVKIKRSRKINCGFSVLLLESTLQIDPQIVIETESGFGQVGVNGAAGKNFR